MHGKHRRAYSSLGSIRQYKPHVIILIVMYRMGGEGGQCTGKEFHTAEIEGWGQKFAWISSKNVFVVSWGLEPLQPSIAQASLGPCQKLQVLRLSQHQERTWVVSTVSLLLFHSHVLQHPDYVCGFKYILFTHCFWENPNMFCKEIKNKLLNRP